MSSSNIESVLFIQQNGDKWEQTWASIENSNFEAYLRIRSDIPSSKVNKGDQLLSFQLKAGMIESKSAKVSLAARSKMMKNKDLPSELHFFNVLIFDADTGDSTYRFACQSENERSTWLSILQAIGMPDSLKAEKAMKRREGIEMSVPGSASRSAGAANESDTLSASKLNSRDSRYNRSGTGQRRDDDEVSLASQASKASRIQALRQRQEGNSNNTGGTLTDREKLISLSPARPPIGMGSSIMGGRQAQLEKARIATDKSNEVFDAAAMKMLAGDDKDEKEYRINLGICSVKLTNILGFIEILLGYPGVILIKEFGPKNQSSFVYSKYFIYLTNIIVVYVLPIIIVLYVLKEYEERWIQRLTITCFLCFFYLIPSIGIIVTGAYNEWRDNHQVDGFFLSKPSHKIKRNITNAIQLIGCIIEWFQIIVMILPAGIFRGDAATPVIESYWPHWNYNIVYWVTVGMVYSSVLIMMLPGVLRGKTLYKYLNWQLPWHILFLVGNVLFLSFCIILMMSLWCDYSVAPAVFVQDVTIECYSKEHQTYAVVGFVALGTLILQNVLLPAGSFKETISNSLDIIFTPKYLSMHTILKVFFAGIYVFFYDNNLVRIPWMTVLCLLMLLFNNRMAPCCVANVNTVRDVIFGHGCMAGVTGSAYLSYLRIWHNTDVVDYDTKWLYLYIFGATVFFSIGWLFLYLGLNKIIPETAVASGFVEIENNPSGVGVNSRVLEPLVAMSISADQDDIISTRKYISKLIVFVTHSSERVQVMALKAMASMCLTDEDARKAFHSGGGTRVVLEQFDVYHPVVQSHALAFLANVSLSDVAAEAMVRTYNCIPFMLEKVNGYSPKQSLFALICIGNLTRREQFREQIRCSQGIQTLVNCLMSHDYQKRKFGALALSNMALSQSEEMDNVLKTRGLIERVMKMATRQEIETQREIVALLRNLACHSNLRPVLLDAGIMNILSIFHNSVHASVPKWADEIDSLMRREIAHGSLEDYKGISNPTSDIMKKSKAVKDDNISDHDREFMKRMSPLNASVEWSTWGSELESLFAPIVEIIPRLESLELNCDCAQGEKVLVNLSVCLSAKTYVQWRNDAQYILTTMPSKGKLSHYVTQYDFKKGQVIGDTDSVVYEPYDDAHGTDTFTFVVQLGAKTTSPCTIKVVIDDLVDDKSEKKPLYAKILPCLLSGKKGKMDDYDDDEYESAGKRYSIAPGNKNDYDNEDFDV